MINLPKECLVDKFIPKKTFYEKVNISSTIKQEFIDKLEKITWKYKIAEENIHISKTEKVEEIEVFEIILKENYNCKNIIKIITKKISYPILFIVKFQNDYQYAIKYDEEIYFSEWNEDITINFSELNLEYIYENIVRKLVKIVNTNTNLHTEIEKIQQISKLQAEIDKLTSKIKKEQQFNRKVELNKQLLELKRRMEELTNG